MTEERCSRNENKRTRRRLCRYDDKLSSDSIGCHIEDSVVIDAYVSAALVMDCLFLAKETEASFLLKNSRYQAESTGKCQQ
jgi:hypothetical protein